MRSADYVSSVKVCRKRETGQDSHFYFKKIQLSILKAEIQRDTQRDTEGDAPTIGPLPKRLKHPEPGQINAVGQEIPLETFIS